VGSYFTNGATRADVIAELTEEKISEDRIFRTLRKCFRGNTMYALHESGKPGEVSKWICVYLLIRGGEYHWGYKPIEESMGPYYFDCPVSYLDEADATTSQSAIEWRAEVRRLAAIRSSIKPKVGEVWSLTNGCTVKRIRITSLRPLRGTFHGTIYKLKKKLLVEKVEGCEV